MKAGYYMDHTGDLAVRYPFGGWHIMNGYFDHTTYKRIDKDDIWFLESAMTRDEMAIESGWIFLGGL